MSWQVEDADANRQGLTISEFGESGGPGMGGCPLGPTDQAAPRPGTASVVRSADKKSVKVTWAPATAQPGAAPVTGYSIVAVADTASATGERTQVGVRTGAPATQTTIAGLDPAQAYDVEVRSRGRRAHERRVRRPGARHDVRAPTGDLSRRSSRRRPPRPRTAVAHTKTVTLTADEAADIYYTTDGSAALANGDLPSNTAKLYTGRSRSRSDMFVKFVAFDRAGNFSQGVATYAPPVAADPVPNAPLTGNSTGGEGTLTLRWSATDPTITGFRVQLIDNPTGQPVGWPAGDDRRRS